MRVGVLEELVYAWFDHSAAESRGKPSSARTIPSSSPARALEIVVDDPVGELVLGGQLLLGDLEPGVDRVGASRCRATRAARAARPGPAAR